MSENENSIPDSDYRFYDRQSDRLIVWFGGINEPFMSANFANEMNCDVLSVADSRYKWYTQGVLPHHETIDEGVAWMREASNSYAEVIYIGQSSGGYGALLYAATLNPAMVIAFSPQTRNFFNGQNSRCPAVQLVDLRSIYTSNTRSTRIILNVGQSESDHENEFCWNDRLQVEPFTVLPYATLTIHPYNNHNISGKLKADGLLYRYLSGTITTHLG
jgi:hypothetical protein